MNNWIVEMLNFKTVRGQEREKEGGVRLLTLVICSMVEKPPIAYDMSMVTAFVQFGRT